MWRLKKSSKNHFEGFRRLLLVLELIFYKGKKIAEGDLTLAGLNKKTADAVDAKAGDMKIKASMSVEHVEGLFKSQFGTTVQIKSGGKLVDDKLSLGDARRASEG